MFYPFSLYIAKPGKKQSLCCQTFRAVCQAALQSVKIFFLQKKNDQRDNPKALVNYEQEQGVLPNETVSKTLP